MRRTILTLLLVLAVLTTGLAATTGSVAASGDDLTDGGSGGSGDCDSDCTITYDPCPDDAPNCGAIGGGGMYTPQ